jgi:hypothetical protein
MVALVHGVKETNHPVKKSQTARHENGVAYDVLGYAQRENGPQINKQEIETDQYDAGDPPNHTGLVSVLLVLNIQDKDGKETGQAEKNG